MALATDPSLFYVGTERLGAGNITGEYMGSRSGEGKEKGLER
jgi:hypothetical protein